MSDGWTHATLWLNYAAQVMVLLFGLALLLLVSIMLWIAHRDKSNKKINLDFILYDKETGTVTLAKLLGLLAGAAGTWVLVYMTVVGRFDSTYAVFYLGIMIAGKVAADITNKMGPK